MTTKNVNAAILMLFLFIPSITTPLKIKTESGLSVWVLTAILIIISFEKEKLKINKKFVCFILIINTLFLLNILVVSYKDIIISMYRDFFIFSTISLYLTFKEIDYEYLIKIWYKLGIINLLIWLLFWSTIIEKVNYMFLGTSLLLSFTIIYYNFLNKRYILDILLLVVSYILLMIFGSRGSFLTANIIIIVLLLYKVKYKYLIVGISMLLLSVLSIFIDYKQVIYNILIEISYKMSRLGLSSYSIDKFIIMITEGLVESSSGRDDIYLVTNNILDEGLIPRGIGYFQHLTGINYPHNFILDALIIFGFLAIPLFLYVIIRLVKFFVNNHNNSAKKDVVLMLLILTLGRLSLSSTFIHETTFWILAGILLYNSNLKPDNLNVIKKNKNLY